MFLARISTANPPPVQQTDIRRMLGLADSEFAGRVFDASAIRTRCLVLDEAMAAKPMNQRIPAIEDAMYALAVQALEQLAVEPDRVSAVVVATFYSLQMPTLAHRLVESLFTPDTPKPHLAGGGCAGAVPALDVAYKYWQADPTKDVLVVCADFASVFLAPPAEDERARIVGSSIFGDGVAVVRFGTRGTNGPTPQLLGLVNRQFPGTADRARFAVTDDGGYVAIDPRLPAIAGEAIPPFVAEFLAPYGLRIADVTHWALHPGGRAILDALQRGLGLSDAQVAPARAVLAEHGNMSTPSGLFVLDRLQRDTQTCAGEYGLMVTIGPGLTVGLALLHWT